MTSDSQNNSPNHPQNDRKDDEVLAQLFKKGAKEAPPAKLNSKILNYAANPDKSVTAPTSVGSHFGGGWKVPLSMAASVVVVFALLVQLDQTPQQLELPPIPEISIPSEDSAAKSQPMSDENKDEHNEELFEKEIFSADDSTSFKNDRSESDLDSQRSGALIIDNPTSTKAQRPADSVQAKPVIIKPNTSDSITIKKSVDIKVEEKSTTSRERTQIQQESKANPPAPASTSSSNPSSTTTSTISKSKEGYAPLKSESLAKPQAAKKQMQPLEKEILNHNATDTVSGKSSNTSSGAGKQQRSMQERRDTSITSDMEADSERSKEFSEESVNKSNSDHIQTNSEFAPIPVEDWLLMIEKLVAQKDYAEAARQLTKFKQAHPKVNVEDLDAKIP